MTTTLAAQSQPKFRKQVTEYEVLQVTPTDQFVAVFHEKGADQRTALLVVPLQAIGVAVVKLFNCFEHRPNEETERWHQIVGLELSCGQWEIVDEVESYQGMVLKGDDLTYFCDQLRGQYGPDYDVPITRLPRGEARVALMTPAV